MADLQDTIQRPVDEAYAQGINQMGQRGPQVGGKDWLLALAHALTGGAILPGPTLGLVTGPGRSVLQGKLPPKVFAALDRSPKEIWTREHPLETGKMVSDRMPFVESSPSAVGTYMENFSPIRNPWGEIHLKTSANPKVATHEALHALYDMKTSYPYPPERLVTTLGPEAETVLRVGKKPMYDSPEHSVLDYLARAIVQRAQMTEGMMKFNPRAPIPKGPIP